MKLFKKKEKHELVRALNKNKVPDVSCMLLISTVVDGTFSEFSINVTDFRVKELTDEYYLNNYIDIDWDIKDNFNGMKTMKCTCQTDIEFRGVNDIPYHIYLTVESTGKYKLISGWQDSLKRVMYIYIKSILTNDDILTGLYPSDMKFPENYCDLVVLDRERQYTGYASKTIFNNEVTSVRSVSNTKNDETKVVFKSFKENKIYTNKMPSFIAESNSNGLTVGNGDISLVKTTTLS